MARPTTALNRTQGIVLVFFMLVSVALLAIVALAPDIFDQTLRQLPFAHGRAVELTFVGTLSIFLIILSIGVVQRWRWLFWLILAAFAAGVLRLPVSVFELTGTIALQGPAWYVALQGAIGVVQFVIALAMFRAYRRGGIWGDSRSRSMR
jgi:hypothetical protein